MFNFDEKPKCIISVLILLFVCYFIRSDASKVCITLVVNSLSLSLSLHVYLSGFLISFCRNILNIFANAMRDKVIRHRSLSAINRE